MANCSNYSAIHPVVECSLTLKACAQDVGSLCCFLAIVVEFMIYFRSTKTAVFFYEFNDEELVTAFKMLSKYYIQPKIFSLKEIPSDSIVNTLSEINWFFVWSGRHPEDIVRSNRLLREMSTKGLMEKPRAWMVMINGKSEQRETAVFSDVELSPASYVGVITRANEDANCFELRDVYRDNNENTLTSIVVGKFLPNYHYKKLRTFPHTLRPLKNYTVRVSTLRRTPFVDYDAEKDSLTGFLGYIMNAVKHMVNLRYDVTVIPDNKSIFTELDDDRADVILGVHTMNKARAQRYDYSSPVISGVILLTFRRLNAVAESTAYTKPFSTDAWMLIFGFCLTVIVELWLTFIFSPFSPIRSLSNESKYGYSAYDDVYTLKTSVLMSFGALLQRGAAYLPEMRSSQVVWLVYFTFCYVVYAMGTSKFTSFLTVVKQPLPFTSIDDLIENTNYKLRVIYKSSRYDLYHNSTDPKNMEIDKRIDKYVINSQEGVDDAYSKKVAFIDHDVQCIPFIYGNCDLQTVPVGDHYQPGFYLVFKKNFALTKIYNIAIAKLYESGILERLTRGKFSDYESFCRPPNKTHAIKFGQILYLLAFLGLAIMVAVVIGLVECFVNRSFPKSNVDEDTCSAKTNSTESKRPRAQSQYATRKVSALRRLVRSGRVKIYIGNNRR